MSLLFCNISWMTSYQGQYNDKNEVVDQPARGGKYVQDNGEAHESCNFLADENDLIYGHVETWRGNGKTGKDTEIKLENLGASKLDPYIDGIDVIWIATHPQGGKRVIGWYKGARVYRHRQTYKHSFATEQHQRDNIDNYRIVCNKRHVHLIKESKRVLKLDPNNVRTGWPGRSSTFYPSRHDSNDELNIFIRNLFSFIKTKTIKNETKSKETTFEEGKKRISLHKKKERSSKLIREFKAQLSEYCCTVCGFAFEKFYGPIGKEYIEAHHIKPISTLTEKTKVTISDLAAVCSNCHRMLHRSSEITTISQLENLIETKKSK